MLLSVAAPRTCLLSYLNLISQVRRKKGGSKLLYSVKPVEYESMTQIYYVCESEYLPAMQQVRLETNLDVW